MDHGESVKKGRDMKTMNIGGRALLAALAIASLPVAAVQTDTYYHNDVAGTPVAASDSAGTLLWKQSYKPYGERIDPKAPADQQPWFMGKAFVEGAGLAYFGTRWYDPQIGRYMGVDLNGFDEKNVASFNRYSYSGNNPYARLSADWRNPLGVVAWEATILRNPAP
jgi:RHS repeat-associated protein